MSKSIKNIIFSPHYDDAVLSCGGLIKLNAGEVLIVTVFAKQYEGLTSWDKKCGFKERDNVSETRRDEDKAALEYMGCSDYRYLDFAEEDVAQMSNYKNDFNLKETLKKIIEENSNVENVYLPLGVANNDHKKLRSAFLSLIASNQFAGKKFFLYEDFPYVADRFEYFKSLNKMKERFILEKKELNIKSVLKDKVLAILRYKSQIKPIFAKEGNMQIIKSLLSVHGKINYCFYLLFGFVSKAKEQYWLIKK